MVDLIQNDEGKSAFLVIEKGAPIIKGSHEIDEVIFIPPPVNKIRWLIPRVSEVLKYYASDSDAHLFQDLFSYHKSISELPNEHYYKYLAVWDMHTYLMEYFEYSPINWFYAVPERGKSRTGKSIIYVAWRGMTMVTFKESHVIRFATDYKATLFLDVMDLWKRVERSGNEDIILSRYERGITVPKVLNPDKRKFEDTEFFELFGPTLVATNMPVHRILETRAVQIVMPESERFFENDVKPEDGLPFRERLVAFRARWLLKKLPDDDKPIKGRLGDILRPIRRIVQVVCSDESWFLEFVAELEESRKKDGMDSDEALVLNAVIQSLDKVENGHLLHSDILSKINQQREERYKMSPQKLGRITRSLGFNKYNSGDARGIYIDADLLNRLCQRYGIKQSDGILTI